jgi:rhamnosyltransferase
MWRRPWREDVWDSMDATVAIPARDFGHGRTRNLAMELARGDFVAFLTQDATPVDERWLERLLGAFSLDDDVGLSFGPHLPRPGATPMIQRELSELFTQLAPTGGPTIERAGYVGPHPAFFSNVNSCVKRECWQQVRFRDIGYAEDRAFALDALAKGWSKVYDPEAAVVHSHDYEPLPFLRRYFDEYRGLREAIGYVAPANPVNLLGEVRRSVAADYAYMRESSFAMRARLLWTARSVRHHGGRVLFAALGSRADRLPLRLQRFLSAERG